MTCGHPLILKKKKKTQRNVFKQTGQEVCDGVGYTHGCKYHVTKHIHMITQLKSMQAKHCSTNKPLLQLFQVVELESDTTLCYIYT